MPSSAGLSSLLFALLVVHAGVKDAEQLFAITGVVVLVSVIIHGISATPLSAWYGRKMARETLPEERESTVAGLFQPPANESPRISAQELAERLTGSDPPVVLDVRSRSDYAGEPTKIPGSIRVLADEITNWAANQPRTRPVVAYCT